MILWATVLTARGGEGWGEGHHLCSCAIPWQINRGVSCLTLTPSGWLTPSHCQGHLLCCLGERWGSSLQRATSSDGCGQLYIAPGPPGGSRELLPPRTLPCSLVVMSTSDINTDPCHCVYSHKFRHGPQRPHLGQRSHHCLRWQGWLFTTGCSSPPWSLQVHLSS